MRNDELRRRANHDHSRCQRIFGQVEPLDCFWRRPIPGWYVADSTTLRQPGDQLLVCAVLFRNRVRTRADRHHSRPIGAQCWDGTGNRDHRQKRCGDRYPDCRHAGRSEGGRHESVDRRCVPMTTCAALISVLRGRTLRTARAAAWPLPTCGRDPTADPRRYRL
jgi:hypothetical protein